jgi:guanylate kinase
MAANKDRGLLLVVSGPSGAGKDTICKAFLRTKQAKNVYLSVSATTRAPRPKEAHGKHYFFLSEEGFRERIEKDGFIEWARFCGHYYGTPKSEVEKRLEAGCDVILIIEVQGALQVREAFPGAAFVFVLPPSMSELRARLSARGTESPDKIEKRLETAVSELKLANRYDYILINDDAKRAAAALSEIVRAEKARVERSLHKIEAILKN